jgi:hypothetical protein
MRLMIRNVAIDTEAATRRISSFFRHSIPKNSNRPRGLKIAITTSTIPSSRDSVVAKNAVDDRQNVSHKTNDLHQVANDI